MNQTDDRFLLEGRKAELARMLNDFLPWLEEAEGVSSAGARFSPELGRIIDRLREPFKVGVVGQFRSGKSSLINALVGDEVALVDELEATAAVSRYFHSPTRTGRVVYSNGEVEDASIEDLIRLADQKRSDTRWLERLERLEFGCPSRVLERVEFWDTPGLGGSELNQARAERFVSQLDSAMWVFDAASIGRADIVAAMEELTRRGKLILGVVNKCEHMEEREFDEVRTEIGRLYPNVNFARIVPVSARMALAAQGLGEELGYVAGSLPEDGGLAELISALEQLILSDPDRLSSEAAAGDARAVLLSFADELASETLAVENQLQQYGRLLQTATERADVWYGRILDRVTETCPSHLSQALKERLRQEILALPAEELKTGASKAVSRVLNETVVLQLLQQYWEQEKGAVRSAAEALGMDLRDAIDLSLSAPERLDIVSSSGPTARALPSSEVQAEGQGGLHYAEKVAIGTGLGLGVLGLMIPGPHWPFALAGAIAAYVSARAIGPIRLSRSPEDLRAAILKHVLEEVDPYVAKLKKPVLKALRDAIERCKEESVESVRTHLSVAILKGMSEDEVRRQQYLLDDLGNQARAKVQQLGAFCAAALPAMADTLSQPARFEKGQRGRARELWSDITNLAAREILIVDGSLSSADFDLLTMFESSVPLRIVTWTEPQASSTAQKFIDALRDLRGVRRGSVSVIVPVPDIADGRPNLPEGAYVAVAGRGFVFSRSLSESLSGEHSFEFTPVRPGGDRAEPYERLWSRQTPGYRYISI
ncbi:MAG: dynamin family protein [Fimbriimonadaceae bacterium]